MRRSWLILLATGALAFGGMLATAGPSAASPRFRASADPEFHARRAGSRHGEHAPRRGLHSGRHAHGLGRVRAVRQQRRGHQRHVQLGAADRALLLRSSAEVIAEAPTPLTNVSPISNCENFSVTYVGGGSIWGF